MNKKLNQIVTNETLEFLKSKLILPFLEISLDNYDERCYKVFTEELANVLEEYAPEYFETDYHSRIGEYFFSSLYDSFVPEEILLEIIKAEEDSRIEGVKIYFTDPEFKVLNSEIKDIILNRTLRFDNIDELISLVILKHLNNA